MKGDFSRLVGSDVRYSRVLAQQGRAQLDADWNEQQALVDYRLRTALSDVFGHGELIGSAIAPKGNSGFRVHLHHGAAFTAQGPLPQPFSARVDTAKPFSVEGWIKPASPITDGTILAAYIPNVETPVFRVGVKEGALVLETGAERALESAQVLSSVGYTFFACAFTGDAAEIWINGQLDCRAAAALPPQPPLRCCVGHSDDPSSPNRFVGAIERIEFLAGRRFGGNLYRAFITHTAGRQPVAEWHASAQHGNSVVPELCVGPGRCYVDGLLCQSEAHRPPAPLPAPHLVGRRPLAAGAHGTELILIDVWERYLSAFEDSTLLEPALGGLDTTGRLRTVSRAYAFPVEEEVDELLEAIASFHHDRGEIALELTQIQPQDNCLYRFEVHADGPAATDRSSQPVITLSPPSNSTEVGARRTVTTADPVARAWECGQYLHYVDANGAPTSTILEVVSVPVEGDGGALTLTISGATPDMQGPIAVRPIASILWSKNNAHGVFTIDKISTDRSAPGTTTIDLRDVANRDAERIALLGVDNTVVITWEERVESFEPGIMTRIIHVANDIPGTITVTVPVAIDRFGSAPTLRCWDGVFAANSCDDGVTAGDLKVRCSPMGTFRSGDYWVAPVRPDADVSLDWPRAADGSSLMRPPLGVSHIYAPLAFVTYERDGGLRVRDLRREAVSADDLWDDVRDVLRNHEPEPRERVIERVIESPREIVIERVTEPVRPEFAVLSSVPIEGYGQSASFVDARVEALRWRGMRSAPQRGRAQAAAVERSLYVLYEDGSLWTRDPRHDDNPWERCAPAPESWDEAALCAAGNRIFLIGGRDLRRRERADVFAYDPRTGAWSTLAPLHAARAAATAVFDGRRVLVFGGTRRAFGSRFLSRTVEAYDFETCAWQRLAPMMQRRARAAGVRWGASVLLIGGTIGEHFFDPGRTTARVDRYIAATNGWSFLTELNAPAERPRAAIADGEVLVVAEDGATERLAVLTGESERGAPAGRGEGGLAIVDSVAYLISGLAPQPVDTADACTIFERFHVLRKGET